MYKVYMDLFFVFEKIMRSDLNSISSFQKVIQSGKLTKDYIELGLQNKCLNNTYQFDAKIKDKLLVIGEGLFESSTKIEKTVERVFSFSQYLTANEILLLEKILKKMQEYDFSDYNKDAITVFNGIKLIPVNPSLSYLRNNLTELYYTNSEIKRRIFES